MKPLYRNLFFAFGLLAIGLLIWRFPDGWQIIRHNLDRVVRYLPLVVGSWIPVYALNAYAFQLLINTGHADRHVSLARAAQLTVSGFAFSYTTPFGSGGAPYRVLELSHLVGTQRALASVTLYSLLHVFSHFFLWTTALIVFVVCHFSRITPWLAGLFSLYLLLFVAAILFFQQCYKRGVALRFFQILGLLPLIGGWAKRFREAHQNDLLTIDSHIRTLYAHPRVFLRALLAEYVGRLFNSFEFYGILLAFGLTNATLADGLIILGFSSLMGNLLFFLPMQLGAREGSLAVIVALLFPTVGASMGIYASFFTRIREIFWIVIGVALVKIKPAHRHSPPSPQ